MSEQKNATGKNDGNGGASGIVKRYIPGIKLFTDYETSWWRPDTITAMSL